MKVNFANAEIDAWQLRKGVVLGCGSQYVHLNGFYVTDDGLVKIYVEFYDGGLKAYYSRNLEWLSPH